MAKNTITHITDDIDGSQDASEVTFSFDGVDYTIDLAKKNRTAFEKAVKPYLQAATKVGKASRRSAPKTARRTDLADVRAWAKEQGLNVSERGRISADVLEAYDAAP